MGNVPFGPLEIGNLQWTENLADISVEGTNNLVVASVFESFIVIFRYLRHLNCDFSNQSLLL